MPAGAIDLVHAKPLLDDVLREEANFANRDYAPYADKLEVCAAMYRKYAAPSDLWDWRQMAAILLGELAGKALLDYGFLMKHARFLGDFDDVTDHEHNLTWDQIEGATKRFSRTLTYPYHLLYRLKRLVPTKLYDVLRRLDHSMLAMLPSLRRYCGAVVIQVVK